MSTEGNTPTPPLFNRDGQFRVVLKRIDKSVDLRFPTDEEIIRRESRMRTFYRKGNSIPEVEGQDEADAELFEAVKKGGDDLKDGAQSRAVEILLRAEATEPTRIRSEKSENGYSIPITVIGGIETIHELREPTEKEIRKHGQRSLWMGNIKFGRQEARSNLSSVGDFYDKLHLKSTGYDGAVPLSHKAVAVNALLQQIRFEEEQDEVDPAENFQ